LAAADRVVAEPAGATSGVSTLRRTTSRISGAPLPSPRDDGSDKRARDLIRLRVRTDDE